LNRTPASAGNRQIFSFACWVKRGTLGTDYILSVRNGTGAGVGSFYIGFRLDQLQIVSADSAGNIEYLVRSAAVYRDPSAWYHIVCAVDTTQATSSNRVKIYVNGVQVTALDGASSYPTQNLNSAAINTTVPHYFGREDFEGGTAYHDYYLAEIYFINGTQLTPSSFGTTDAYGIWQPIPYTGSYGTNGFYLPFTDNSALTTSSNVGLGKDFSGNGNYWVTNNISITAGSTYDSMVDVPTNTNQNTANYCVLNPLTTAIDLLGVATLSNGNLQSTSGGNNARLSIGTIFVNSGKWYAECTITTSFSDYVGIGSQTNANSTASGTGAYSYTSGGTKISNGSSSAYGASYTTGDVIGVAYDADAGSLTFYKNGTSQGTAFTGITTSILRAFCSFNGGSGTYVHNWNFGQRPFAYTPPTGFLPLNTYNLQTPTILDGDQYMDALLYTGNGSASQRTDISWTNMQPDMVWIKNRTSANNHVLHDDIRGTTEALQPNLTNATDSPVGFGSDGFGFNGVANQLRIFTTDGRYNTNGNAYVTWGWKGSGAAGVSNTQGTITSTVSANTTAGFSVVTYTATAADPITVGHGLGVAPSMFIVKSRSSAGTDWFVYHSSLGATQNLRLNTTAAAATATNVWNNTAPTSTVITTSNAINTNTQTYVAYCFAQVAGYSAFGSYTGNGSTDGPFVYTGFRPRFVMVKASSSASNWFLWDTARNTYNATTTPLFPNGSSAEEATLYPIDVLSNGFKLRSTAGLGPNENALTYIYACFAENPFKISRAR
jgi:hypothetical protein